MISTIFKYLNTNNYNVLELKRPSWSITINSVHNSVQSSDY